MTYLAKALTPGAWRDLCSLSLGVNATLLSGVLIFLGIVQVLLFSLPEGERASLSGRIRDWVSRRILRRTAWLIGLAIVGECVSLLGVCFQSVAFGLAAGVLLLTTIGGIGHLAISVASELVELGSGDTGH